MAQRHTVSGRRSIMAWLAIILVLMLAILLVIVRFIFVPQEQLRQQAQATAEARQTEVERLYAVGVVFQNAGDCVKAAEALAQVINLEPSYKDARTRLAEARACQQAAEATATAQAIAMAQATVEAQATATADARALAQATAATATAVAEANAARVTAEAAAAIEATYQRGLGYYNLERWAEAKAAFEEVFAVDPTYKDIQAKLAEVEAKLAEAERLIPTIVPIPTATSTSPLQTPQIINVALDKPADAPRSMETAPPNRAVDGDPNTWWCAPGQTGTWEVKLNGATIVKIEAISILQYEGPSKHEMRLYTTDTRFEAKSFERSTKTRDIFSWELDQPLENVQRVRMVTTQAPAWICWAEVRVFGYYPP
jgi:tetratricopeptide (TPR) repeat protein